MTEKVSTTSENTQDENLDKLRKVFPQFVKDGEVDFDALKTFFDTEGIVAGTEKYGLNWAGKSNAFRLIRETAKGTLVPQEKESKDWDKTENVFIEGDNLEVLKLLQKKYREQIKMIYIDPPYNTGKDFVYKDNFTQSVADYYEQTGQTQGGIKMTANTERNGRYHSDWLTMMYPRLFLAKNLLREDGVIFISIDDNEVANLRLIMDEIFGEENFEGHVHWRRRHNQPNDPTKLIALVAEHILVYARNSESLKASGVGKLGLTGVFSNPDGDLRGDWNSKPWKVGSNQNGSKYSITLPSGRIIDGEWMGENGTYEELLKDNRVYFSKDGDGLPRKKIFKSEREETGQSATNWFENGSFGNNQDASAESAELFDENKNIFDNPKPVRLLKSLVRLGNVKEDELVLDFFAGSGTTAHAMMDLNAEDGGSRKFICVQLPEVTDEESEAYNAGYKNIAEISRERIRRAGEKIGKGDVGFKSFALQKSNYRQWNVLTENDDQEKLLAQSKLFLECPLVDGYDERSVVYEILIKEGFSLNTHVKQGVVILDTLHTHCWSVKYEGKEMVISFDEKITKEQVESLNLKPEDIFVCFDSALDDMTKINISRNVNLKVI
jgi:adenine-specific DNA-methyltransferase